ncbi:hypothetical protein PIB30_049170 [Stylosanthes scabra]|uniref:Uncharacterized protein n=1 Tax=Stylosanthes scabra TaxID=79078 RepID=A0ABU6RHY6_9FABA|nr:hypothetical protein [Stylosanthes scabra]
MQYGIVALQDSRVLTTSTSNESEGFGRLRPILPKLVGDVQIAFVSSRKIHDGALIACEIVHWVKMKKSPAWLIKLDF